MSRALETFASRVGCSERTLRRYLNDGLLRARRKGLNRLELAPGEAEYLREHWHTLSALKRALRTERGVQLAVLFGSVATGEDTEGSDVDVYVRFRDDGHRTRGLALQSRLAEALGRPVHVVTVAAEEAPNLAASVLREGRVLVDRDDAWASFQERERAIRRAAGAETDALLARARSVLAEATP